MRYLAYGLALESDVRLPELSEIVAVSSAQPDVNVKLAQPLDVLPEALVAVQTRAHDDGTPWINIARTASGYLVSEAGTGHFAVDRYGREVILCRAGPEACELTLRHVLLDWVLALVLSLRGKQVLHASTIVTAWGICAFAGPSGSGKSTLAASFASAGYPVLCDDCLVLERNDKAGCFECTPAYPGLRLWDDSVEALGLRQHVTQRVAGYMPKHRVAAEGHAYDAGARRHPLARVYCPIRVRGAAAVEASRIEPLEAKDALMRLIACSWLCDPTDKTAVIQRFRFFASLASQGNVKLLRLPDDMAALPAVRSTVLADLASEQGARLNRSGIPSVALPAAALARTLASLKACSSSAPN